MPDAETFRLRPLRNRSAPLLSCQIIWTGDDFSARLCRRSSPSLLISWVVICYASLRGVTTERRCPGQRVAKGPSQCRCARLSWDRHNGWLVEPGLVADDEPADRKSALMVDHNAGWVCVRRQMKNAICDDGLLGN